MKSPRTGAFLGGFFLVGCHFTGLPFAERKRSRFDQAITASVDTLGIDTSRKVSWLIRLEPRGLAQDSFSKHSKDTDRFEETTWDKFFEELHSNQLELLDQEEKHDREKDSTFHKFVDRKNWFLF